MAADGGQGLYFIFPSGERPDARAIRAAVESLARISVSHDPAQSRAAGEAAEPGWIELLIDGMTFDLSGLAPAEPAEPPEPAHRFDCPPDLLDGREEALKLLPGPHLAEGANFMTVVRAMTGLAAALAEALPALSAIAWAPSASLIGPEYFRTTVAAWLAGGPFPALGLTAFRETMDKGLQSVGLEFLIGQELRLEPELVGDRAAAARLAVRLVDHLVATGRVAAAERITAPDGRRLRLEPSPNGRFVRAFNG